MRALSAGLLGWPLALVAMIMTLTGSAGAATVFGVDTFDSGVQPNWSSGSFTLGVDTTPSGQNFLGISGDASNFGLSSGSVTLTVPTAAAHNTATVQFRLYVIRSMDGEEPFSLSANGIDRINPDALFSNLGSSSCTDNVSAGCTSIGATNAPAGTVGPVVGELDFPALNAGAVGDTYYDLTLTFAHTASNLELVFSYSGQQSLFDESWGLDNVSVQIDSGIVTPPSGVPSPVTLWLLGLGISGLAASARIRRSASHSR